MEQLPEVPNIKIEPTDSTSSDQFETPTEMQNKSVKQESDCLVQSEIYIKTEPQDDEDEVPVIAGTSNEKISYDSIKFTTIKIECGDLKNEKIQDPLDIGNAIEGEDSTSVPDFGEVRSYRSEQECFQPQDSGGSINQPDQFQDRNIQITKTKKHPCHVCNKTFKSKTVLKNHLRIHTGEKPFVCHICQRSFNQKGHLDRHLLVHTGVRPLTCDVCDESFNLKSNLNKHMRIHYSKKPNSCDVCMRVFKLKSDLNVHKVIHSGMKPYSCSECDRSFNRKQNLVRHKRLHTGDKPHICDVCTKAFTNKANLIVHKRLHTGERPYCCDMCDKTYKQLSGLNYHKQVHH